MKKRFFPFLIALSALLVSGSAAFYSVFGLSKLFAGASTQVIIMAGSLEFAKLIVASLLYQYWDTINKALRMYLMVACLVLMVITSGGIYGFLSGAYQSTATQSELLDKSLAVLEQKQIRFEETKEDLKIEKTQLTKSISDLRIALSSPTQVQYIDKESGQLITTTSSSARRALQSELKTTIADRNEINLKLEAVTDSITKTDMTLLNKEISNEDERELGPLKYLAETTGADMGTVVNWFLLLIIFVFDPLAIALVVTANMAFARINNTEDDDTPRVITSEKDLSEKEKNELSKAVSNSEIREPEPYTPTKNDLDRLEEILGITNKGPNVNIPTMEVSTTGPSDELKERVKDNQEKLREPKDGVVSEEITEESEQRMNIIGQNGNDGLHYEEIDDEDNPPYLDRLTDTTQTLIVEEKEKKDENTLRYKGR